MKLQYPIVGNGHQINHFVIFKACLKGSSEFKYIFSVIDITLINWPLKSSYSRVIKFHKAAMLAAVS